MDPSGWRYRQSWTPSEVFIRLTLTTAMVGAVVVAIIWFTEGMPFSLTSAIVTTFYWFGGAIIVLVGLSIICRIWEE